MLPVVTFSVRALSRGAKGFALWTPTLPGVSKGAAL